MRVRERKKDDGVLLAQDSCINVHQCASIGCRVRYLRYQLGRGADGRCSLEICWVRPVNIRHHADLYEEGAGESIVLSAAIAPHQIHSSLLVRPEQQAQGIRPPSSVLRHPSFVIPIDKKKTFSMARASSLFWSGVWTWHPLRGDVGSANS